MEWVLQSVVHHGLSRQCSTTRLKLHEIYCNKQYFSAQRSNREFDKYDKTWLQIKEYHLLERDTMQSDRQVLFEKKTLLSSAGYTTHLHISSTSEMKGIGSSKLVPFYQTAWCHNSKESVPHGHCFLTLRRLMSYIYGAPILDVSRSHTTTQHSRQDSSG